ncbi:TPD1 protein homolog 1-like [Punica granatum]|uniref:TPD1 protein homolog 1-like n=1 Tax=Punica granatum TaxID=22663 RepID=A0A218XSX2_PUNGR|nr:TPD1 protein homolog 1-like [Punica granatum]OWM88053.1 hypothetical protein CDL15_Pgr016626 [Punica granatum]
MSPCRKFLSCTVLIVLIIMSCLYIRHPGSSVLLSSSQSRYVNDTRAMVNRPEKEILGHRKLLFYGSCSNRDISISQSRDSMTSGIPQYIVQIVNTCINSGCAPSNIHVHCGWFASARIVNPRAFKRLSYDDCLVNAGKPLKGSQIVRFTYSNSFMYPLAFKSANFC